MISDASHPTTGPTEKSAPAEELVAAGYAWEIADAPLLHHSLNIADLAHAVELTERNVLPDAAARALLGALLELTSMPAHALGYDPRHGELYDSRERRLEALIGPDAGWLRAGRTRREAVRTALRMTVRRQVLDLIESSAALAGALAERSEPHLDTLMPDYTYLQQAQPTTFAHYLSSFADPVLRDAERLLAEYGRINASPAGAGAANGSRIVTDRQAAARRLGFDRAVDHTRDAMWQTDAFLHVLTATTSLAITQDKLAEDLEIFASTEFGFVRLSEGHTRTSVLMPQKRNPYALSVIRGSAGVLIGRLAGQAAVTKTPSARSDNLIYLYGELPRALDLAGRVLRLSAGVVHALEIDRGRMRAALDAGYSQATDLAEWLMTRFAIDYRTAHRIVHKAVHSQHPASTLNADALARASRDVLGVPWQLDDDELNAVVDPDTLVHSRTVLGGAAPGSVATMLARIRAQTGELRSAAAARREAIDAAEDAVRAHAEELARPPNSTTK
jgi:argininosuccinate lyase